MNNRASLSRILLAGLLVVAMPGLAQTGQTKATPSNDGVESNSTRADMAMNVLKAMEAVSFVPPPCVPGSELFTDVPASSPYCAWIEELYRRGITGGCGPGLFCPTSPVPREQMAVFLVVGQGPRGQALITRQATVRPQYQKGAWTARRPASDATGVYCMSAVGFDPAVFPAIVTVEWGASLGFDLLAYWRRDHLACNANEYEVRTYDFAAGGAPVLTNEVEFLLVIP